MENLTNLWGGFQDDTVVPSKTFDNLLFGLNQNVEVLKFEYNTNTGAGKTPGNPAVDIEVAIGTNKINKRIFEPNKVYFENNEIDSTHPEYKKQFTKEIGKIKGMTTHWLKALGYTEEQISAGLATANNFQSLITLASNMINAVKAVKRVDLFLQYQYSINSTADKTYLEIPKTLGYGAFVTEHVAPVGEWKQVNSFTFTDAEGKVQTENNGIAYIDDAGNQHRFTRHKIFMDSTFSKQQNKSGAGVSGISQGTGSAPANTGTSVTW